MVEISYALYLMISIAITIRVARTLSKNGEVFLVQCFGHNREIAHSTNHCSSSVSTSSTSASSR